eukprot:scaffold315737_cov26-Tisochrysis_lutea.AAC.3
MPPRQILPHLSTANCWSWGKVLVAVAMLSRCRTRPSQRSTPDRVATSLPLGVLSTPHSQCFSPVIVYVIIAGIVNERRGWGAARDMSIFAMSFSLVDISSLFSHTP